jgi:hypothetical protein
MDRLVDDREIVDGIIKRILPLDRVGGEVR